VVKTMRLYSYNACGAQMVSVTTRVGIIYA